MSGKWIVFEGLDGAGTTSQVRLLTMYLTRQVCRSEQVFTTAEPTHGPFGEICRMALRHQLVLDRRTLALAFTADRSHHLHRADGLLFHQSQHHWIVQDRYFYSTLAYQDGTDREWLWTLCQDFPRPDLLVFIDTPLAICLERITRRGAKREVFEQQEVLEQVLSSYRWVLEQEQDRGEILILDGTASKEELHAQVVQQIT